MVEIGTRVAVAWEDIVDNHPQAFGRMFIAKFSNDGKFFKTHIVKVSTYYLFNKYFKRKNPVYYVEYDFVAKKFKLLEKAQ